MITALVAVGYAWLFKQMEGFNLWLIFYKGPLSHIRSCSAVLRAFLVVGEEVFAYGQWQRNTAVDGR